MKWMLWILLAAPVLACDNGCTPYEGTCACEASAEKAVQTYKPSDEEPPRHPEPAWQRGDVIAATPPSQASEDAKMDQEKAQADAEGKKAAGLK